MQVLRQSFFGVAGEGGQIDPQGRAGIMALPRDMLAVQLPQAAHAEHTDGCSFHQDTGLA